LRETYSATYVTAIVKPPASGLETEIAPVYVPGSDTVAATEIVARRPESSAPAAGLTESHAAPAATLNSTGPQKLFSTSNDDWPDGPIVS